MVTVFPSFKGCRQVANEVQGKLEVYVCDGNDRYTIRYSRWATEADRYSYLNEANTAAARRRWIIDGEDSGTSWTSHETPQQDPDENMRYQWSATYATSPFSVSVEGVTPTDRVAGIDHVRARPASQVGSR